MVALDAPPQYYGGCTSLLAMPRNPLISVLILAVFLIGGGVVTSLYMSDLMAKLRGGSGYDVRADAAKLLEEIRARNSPVGSTVKNLAAATAVVADESQETPSQTETSTGPRSMGLTTINRLNDAFNLSLIHNGRLLWDERPGTVARRLKLKRDTLTKRHEIYSRTIGLERVLGASPENIVLYGLDGRLDEIVVSYANRGTHSPKGFRERLRRDEEPLRSALQLLFGPAQREKMASTPGGPSYDVMRWEKREAEVTLYLASNDFVSVRLRRPNGQPSKDDFTPERLAGGVLRFQRGDVLVADIPQIKQGQRPYCVPVSVERVLRHVGLPNHMYALAGSGKVDHLGCDSFHIFEQLDKTLHERNLKLEYKREPIRGVNEDLKESIDAGLPVIWLVHGYVNVFLDAMRRRVARESAASNMAWQVNLISASNFTKINRGQYHACIINGYNERTGEISVIDEIGQFWLSGMEAEKVSQPFAFYVKP